MFRRLFAAALFALPVLSVPALAADFEMRTARGSVAETMDALVSAVEGAGATVFARIDHAQGARSVDMELPEAQLLVFGNPTLGTPVIQADMRAGLMLPLRVLVYDDGDDTIILWLDPEEMLDGLNVDPDADVVRKMASALERLTGAAAGG
ncbi:DUF302 domain-containing protein [Jannaschia sp. M317]|uniref:DUF302 domain-containing protein n=1 Tax=Jannaschia sp. M317 TaxID=2867011 RepID=UPI0021A592B2|nr:DUF302 domain-containing protein [Jannaschia sp. M317]UWQ19312.1 DUF302 domain-containing protein [Jannaschia sp. M317]